MVVFMVSYRRDVPFDTAYYFEQHLPLAARVLTPLGLLKSEILRDITNPQDGSPASEQIVALLYFPSRDVLNRALEDPSTATLMADIRNFYPEDPSYRVADVVENS